MQFPYWFVTSTFTCYTEIGMTLLNQMNQRLTNITINEVYKTFVDTNIAKMSLLSINIL